MFVRSKHLKKNFIVCVTFFVKLHFLSYQTFFVKDHNFARDMIMIFDNDQWETAIKDVAGSLGDQYVSDLMEFIRTTGETQEEVQRLRYRVKQLELLLQRQKQEIKNNLKKQNNKLKCRVSFLEDKLAKRLPTHCDLCLNESRKMASIHFHEKQLRRAQVIEKQRYRYRKQKAFHKHLMAMRVNKYATQIDE